MSRFIEYFSEKPSPGYFLRSLAVALGLSAFHLPAFVPIMGGMISYYIIAWAIERLDHDAPKIFEPIVVFCLLGAAVCLIISGVSQVLGAVL